MDRQCMARRSFLCLGISLTLLGCMIVAAGIALPGWQIMDLPELNAVHEHAIFYDCILSEITPLDALCRTCRRDVSMPIQPSRRCTYKFASNSPWEYNVRMAIEEGDFAARESLNWHRFLPHHKAVIFFTVFTQIFAVLSAVVGACSTCFLPNTILHVVSVGLATTCSMLADVSFFMASQKEANRRIKGTVGTYQQHLGYAFYIHCLGSLILVLAMVCSLVAAYLLLAKQCRRWRQQRWRSSRSSSKRSSAADNNKNNVVEVAEKDEKCLFISDVFSLHHRPRMGTLTSFDEERHHQPQQQILPPPPPTPQQQQQQQFRPSSTSSFRSVVNSYSYRSPLIARAVRETVPPKKSSLATTHWRTPTATATTIGSHKGEDGDCDGGSNSCCSAV